LAPTLDPLSLLSLAPLPLPDCDPIANNIGLRPPTLSSFAEEVREKNLLRAGGHGIPIARRSGRAVKSLACPVCVCYPARMYDLRIPSHIVLVCWIVWAAYWVFSARHVKETRERQSAQSRRRYLVVTIAAFVLLISDTSGIYPLNLTFLKRSAGTRAFGAAICVLGTLLAVWARHVLAGNWSSDVALKENHQLIERGPYGAVRHPIYTGMLAMCLGTATLGGRVAQLVGFVLMFVAFWLKLTQEEELLTAHFPDQYPAYKKRVRALVPFIL